MRPSAPEALRPLRTVALHRIASVTLARREIVLTNLYSSKSYVQFVYARMYMYTLYTKGAAPTALVWSLAAKSGTDFLARFARRTNRLQ